MLSTPPHASGDASSPLANSLNRFIFSPWSLLLAVALAFFLSSWSLPLTDVDEGAFSEATREMMARGNLVSPVLNDQPRHDKPILIYWAQAASVTLLGEHEFGFRLPSLLAALVWLVAIARFARRHGTGEQAHVAVRVMALSLMVGFIAKAAIADALLNLFLCLAIFATYDFAAAARRGASPAEQRRILAFAYLALGLGFLAKGPVAAMFPMLISLLYMASVGQWRDWLRATFWLPGWAIFLAIVVPWHVAVYLDQGDAFFRGFYLHHNVGRYTNTFEGHGGNPLYYVATLPLIVMPFFGWLLAIAGRSLRIARAPLEGSSAPGLERFLWLWFAVVFIFFSFSGTQLPHYLLYGCTPVFLLLARHPLGSERRWVGWLPVILFAACLVALPWILQLAAERVTKPFEQTVLQALVLEFGPGFALAAAGLLLVSLALAFWRRLPVWQGLLLVGLLQAGVFYGMVMPRVLNVTQVPVREAAEVARQSGLPVVAWRIYQPSFSVYRQAVTPTRLPQAGEAALLRTDRLEALHAALGEGLRAEVIYRKAYIALVRVEARP